MMINLKIIKDKFFEKKNEEINILGIYEKRIFLQLIDQNWKLYSRSVIELRWK